MQMKKKTKNGQQLPGTAREKGDECEHSSQTLFIGPRLRHRNQHYSSHQNDCTFTV